MACQALLALRGSTISLPKGYDADQEPEKGKCPRGKSETHLLPKLDEIRDPPESPCIKIEDVESVEEIVYRCCYKTWQESLKQFLLVSLSAPLAQIWSPVMSQRKEEVALGGAWHEEADTILMLAICKMSAQAWGHNSYCCCFFPLCTFVVVLVVPNPTTVTSWPTSPRLGARTGSEKIISKESWKVYWKENKGGMKGILKELSKERWHISEREIWTWQASRPYCVWEGHFCGQSDQGDVVTVQNIVILKFVPKIEVLAALPLSKDSNQGGWWLFQPRRPGLAPIWSHLSDRGTPKTIPQKMCKEDAAKAEAATTK